MLSQYDKENLPQILSGHGDWFTAQLLRLIAKSDNFNRSQLQKGFPAEVALINTYQYGGSEPMCENCGSYTHHTTDCLYTFGANPQ